MQVARNEAYTRASRRGALCEIATRRRRGHARRRWGDELAVDPRLRQVCFRRAGRIRRQGQQQIASRLLHRRIDRERLSCHGGGPTTIAQLKQRRCHAAVDGGVPRIDGDSPFVAGNRLRQLHLPGQHVAEIEVQLGQPGIESQATTQNRFGLARPARMKERMGELRKGDQKIRLQLQRELQVLRGATEFPSLEQGRAEQIVSVVRACVQRDGGAQRGQCVLRPTLLQPHEAEIDLRADMLRVGSGRPFVAPGRFIQPTFAEPGIAAAHQLIGRWRLWSRRATPEPIRQHSNRARPDRPRA